MKKLIAALVAAVILLTVNLLAMCGCTQVMVRSWFLEKEYDIDISFEDFKTVANELDKEKYFVKVDYESAPGDGRIIKQLLEGVGIKTHDSIAVPAGNKIKQINSLVPFDEAKKFLEAKGYVFYPPYENEMVEGTVYVVCSPDGTESYTVIAFWMQKTNEEARAATSWLDPSAFSDYSSGLNIYYCNTYAVRCVGDRWMKITEGIEN